MATKRMLIDAAHPEETRVVVLDGTRLEDYDVEVASRRQLKGNIYLAKVTRVEPSLQAAFVDYGGNRHGFLAFNEIHPDYYQIPVADRQALLAEEEAAERAAAPAPSEENGNGGEVVDIGGEDDDEEIERRRPRLSARNYKIQEVIKRRQIMLVQVAKEERGSKGAALTTYLSLAGRYCVLMPNTSRGGGISRKITNAADRKRLKSVLAELNLPEGMAVIVRTAGAGRSKAEIKRDCDYLLRLWSNIREVTLTSMAPALVHEEGSLIKRSIRDLYERGIEEIIVQGEPEYRIAKEFMKLLIPSHSKRVKLYEDGDLPLFQRYQVEDQLDAMHLPTVQLKSGGYIVINPTEALVAIDVNSGRATRDRHIEETALRTNLEAAEEVARQVRLRDLAGLIVVDFIDMENARNQAQVERRLKEAMKTDRARIQLGRISPFGLLELSRQRLRPSLLETSFETCPFCNGMGVRRTRESTALSILRHIEEEGISRRASEIEVFVPEMVAMYLLNYKRKALSEIEARYKLSVIVTADPALIPPNYRIERTKLGVSRQEEEAPVEDVGEVAATTEGDAEEKPAEAGESTKRGRRRRPRRRGKRSEGEGDLQPTAAVVPMAAAPTEDGESAGENGTGENGTGEDVESGEEDEAVIQTAQGEGIDSPRKRRRRGRRGGRNRARRPDETMAPSAGTQADSEAAGDGQAPSEGDALPRAAESGEVLDSQPADEDANLAAPLAGEASVSPLEVASSTEIEPAANAGAQAAPMAAAGHSEAPPARRRRRPMPVPAPEPSLEEGAGGEEEPGGEPLLAGLPAEAETESATPRDQANDLSIPAAVACASPTEGAVEMLADTLQSALRDDMLPTLAPAIETGSGGPIEAVAATALEPQPVSYGGESAQEEEALNREAVAVGDTGGEQAGTRSSPRRGWWQKLIS
jgi:ribonuclease E